MQRKLAIVTGTTSGLGAAVAARLLDDGWHVIGVARRPSELRRERYEHVVADLSRVEGLRRVLEERAEALRGWERVGLVNNAGRVGPVASLPRTDLDDLVRSATLNALGPAWLMGRIAELSGDARLCIVNVSSGAATRAYPGWGAYCMGKAALRMASQVLAVECEEVPALAGREVAVVSYAPGVIDTAMQADVRASDPAEFPRLQRFLDLQSSGQLVDAALPAAEIVRLLERDDLPRFSEMRYGE